MSDSSVPASAGSPDASVADLRSIADDMSMEAFGFDEEEGEQNGADAGRSEPARPDAPARQEGRARDESGRFAARDGQSEQGSEADPQGEPEADPAPPQGEGEAGEEAQEGQEVAAEGEPEAAKGEEKPKDEPKRVDFVEIDGQRHSVEDVRRGFMRMDDYSRKTQEVARERQAIQGHVQQIQGYERELTGILDVAVNAIREMLPPRPGADLAKNDPIAYAHQMALHTEAAEKLRSVHESHEQMRQRVEGQTQQQREDSERQSQEQQQAQAQQLAQHRQEQIRLAQQKIPELRTPEGEQKFFKQATDYAAGYGVTQEQLLTATVDNHAIALILQDAMLGRSLKEKRPQTTERLKAAPPIRPQARPAAGTREGQAKREANRQFADNPSIKTALGTGVLDNVFPDL